MELILATRNPDKIDEIRAILADLPLTLVPVADLPGIPEVEETGATLEANARHKALVTARAAGRAALAEDTGLEVDALDGAPGVFSARYAGAKASYPENRRKLLAALAGVPAARRTARFRTVVALATPDGRVRSAEGTCEGTILNREEGEGGFGYDSVFRPRGAILSFAAMPAEQKNRTSHRSRALAAARVMIDDHLAGGDEGRSAGGE